MMKGGIKKVAFDVLCDSLKCNFLQSAVDEHVTTKLRNLKYYSATQRCLLLKAHIEAEKGSRNAAYMSKGHDFGDSLYLIFPVPSSMALLSCDKGGRTDGLLPCADNILQKVKRLVNEKV